VTFSVSSSIRRGQGRRLRGSGQQQRGKLLGLRLPLPGEVARPPPAVATPGLVGATVRVAAPMARAASVAVPVGEGEGLP
jgi:hypothetical protein